MKLLKIGHQLPRLFMDLACKMKSDIGVVISLGIQEPFTLRQVNKVPVFICSYVAVLEPRKFLQLFFIFRCDPACFVIWQGVELN